MQKFVRITTYVVRFVLAGILLYAVFLKWRAPQDFIVDIRNYRLLPELLIPWVAKILLGIEFLLGILLLLGIWKHEVAWMTLGLFFIFAVVVASALMRKLSLSCGCFGKTAAPITIWKLIENIKLLVLSIFYVIFIRKNISKNSII